MYYVYMVRCADGTLYTGYTTNVNRRVDMHNKGKGARYTRSRLPVVLLYQETFATKTEALRREYEVKQLTREQKEHLFVSAPPLT